MDSAVKLGGRLPVNPQQREGFANYYIKSLLFHPYIRYNFKGFYFIRRVIVRLASQAPFSQRLLDLQEEVRPLYKMESCDYKRTSVQTTFERVGFKMDWCAFRISNDTDHGNVKHHTRHCNSMRGQKKQWESISKADVPHRNYIDELAFTIAIPGMVFAVLIALLTAILCFQHEKL